MKLNILIATYNRCESLKKTLQSIEKMTSIEPHQFNVIIVDNCSSDSTKEVVEEFQKRKIFEIKYIWEGRQGKVHALNTGFKHADGDVVVFTDDDVTVDENWLKVIVENFGRGDLDCLTGRILPVYDGIYPGWYSSKLDSVMVKTDYYSERRSTDQITGANMAMHRKVIEVIKELKAYEGLINEDTFLNRRLNDHGFRMIYDPAMLVYHHFFKERFTKDYFRRWYWLSGRSIAVMRKDQDLSLNRHIAGVPYWRIKEAFQHFLKMLISCCNEKERFYYELQFRRLCGFIAQRWQDRNSTEGVA